MYLTIKQFILLMILCISFKMAISQNKTLKVKNYYENGALKDKGKFKNEIKTGMWYYYNSIGHLQKKEHWKNGKLKFSIIYNQRQKASEIIYENGNIKKLKGCGC